MRILNYSLKLILKLFLLLSFVEIEGQFLDALLLDAFGQLPVAEVLRQLRIGGHGQILELGFVALAGHEEEGHRRLALATWRRRGHRGRC